MIDITRFSYEAIGVWIVAFLVMEFPMRYIYLNYVEKSISAYKRQIWSHDPVIKINFNLDKNFSL
jgi:hypothetical protein